MTRIIKNLGITLGPDGETVLEGGFVLGVTLTPPAIVSNQDDYTVTDIETAVILRLSATGNRSITGLVPFNTLQTWMLYVVNVGTGNIQLKTNNAGSVAENRFLISTNRTIQTDEGILLFYDPISLRWRPAGIVN